MTEQFQKISFYYSILSDPAKKTRYDQTGIIESNDASLEDLKGDATWGDYFKELWMGVVNEQTIKEYEQRYKGSLTGKSHDIGSEEEVQDVLNAYVECKGKMRDMMERILFSRVEEEDRYRSIVFKAIEEKKVKKYAIFLKIDHKDRQKRRKEEEQEAIEAEALRKELKLDQVHNEDGLAALIKTRNSQRLQATIASIEEKYTKKKNK
jgi:DnaJ family protein C protein 9